jgi:hypothetical protein
MPDALMGVTETTAVALAQVSNLVQTFLIQNSVMLPTVTNYSSLAVPGAKSIALPRSGGFTVGSKSENTAVESQIITFAADTLNLTDHRVIQFLIEDIAEKQAVPAIVQDAIMKASKALALDADNKVIAQLELASSSDPDHQIVFIDTSGDVVAKGDVLNARKLLIDQNINPRECYLAVGSEKEKELLALADFIQAERYGSSTPIQLGEIGMIYGMKVIVHTSITDYMLAWHPSAVGFAFQQGVRFQSEKNLAHLGTRYSLDYLAGFKVLDSGKRCVKVDSTN